MCEFQFSVQWRFTTTSWCPSKSGINANPSMLSSHCVDLALFKQDNQQRGGRGDGLSEGSSHNRQLRGPRRPWEAPQGHRSHVYLSHTSVRFGLTGLLLRPGSAAMNPSYPLSAPEGVEEGLLLSPVGEARSKGKPLMWVLTGVWATFPSSRRSQWLTSLSRLFEAPSVFQKHPPDISPCLFVSIVIFPHIYLCLVMFCNLRTRVRCLYCFPVCNLLGLSKDFLFCNTAWQYSFVYPSSVYILLNLLLGELRCPDLYQFYSPIFCFCIQCYPEIKNISRREIFSSLLMSHSIPLMCSCNST